MSTALTLGQRMVRTAGIFQAIVALPVMLTLGAQVFDHLWYYYYNPNIYQFMYFTLQSPDPAPLTSTSCH